MPDIEITVGVATVTMREERLVSGDALDFHRKHRHGQSRHHQFSHRGRGIAAVLERDEVLELVEVGLELHRIDRVRGTDPAMGLVVIRHRVVHTVIDLDVAPAS